MEGGKKMKSCQVTYDAVLTESDSIKILVETCIEF